MRMKEVNGQKEWFFKTILFMFILLFIYVFIFLAILPRAIEKTEGPSTKKQIETSFNNAQKTQFDLLVCGNSALYHGINPDLFSMPAYNFSHDNDTYNQIFYKLVYLEKEGKKFKYLILGIDYFQFSFISGTRNYVYNELLDKQYQADYKSKGKIIEYIESKNLSDFNRLVYLRNYFDDSKSNKYLKPNGQFILSGKASPHDRYRYSIKRLPIQEKYFEMILAFCKKNNIIVFITMQPTRKNALQNYSEDEMREFNNYVKRHTNSSVFYLNCSELPGYSYEDYTDITHLNEDAANRFTMYLNEAIKKIIYK